MTGIYMTCLQCGEPVRAQSLNRKYCSDRCRTARSRGKEQTRPEPAEMAALEKDLWDNEKYWEESRREHIRTLKKIMVESRLRKFGLL